jgi:hypothetical protein
VNNDLSVHNEKNVTNKTDRHDITEILLKVALNTTKQTDLYIAPIMIHAQQVFTRLYTEF